MQNESNIGYIIENPMPTKNQQIMYEVDNNGCFNCTSHWLDRDGYPRVNRKGKEWIMSRYVYTLYNGEIPEGMVIRHKCDNPRCICPDHLEIGTPQDNNRDKVERNRQAKGDNLRKITLELKLSIKNDPRSALILSKLLKIGYQTVRRIKKEAIELNSSRLKIIKMPAYTKADKSRKKIQNNQHQRNKMAA
jgi:hypothetical protein